MEEAERKTAGAVTAEERDAYLKIAKGWQDLERTASWAPVRGA